MNKYLFNKRQYTKNSRYRFDNNRPIINIHGMTNDPVLAIIKEIHRIKCYYNNKELSLILRGLKKMMLHRFNLESEWDDYYHILNEYLVEVCTEEEVREFQTTYREASYREVIIGLTNRELNPFHICKIVVDGNLVGFVDYVCFVDEDGKALIGNFYLTPETRAHGLGSRVYQLVEAQLRLLGAKYIDVTPSPKAISFYLKHGFIQTSDHSLENDEIVYRKFFI